VIDRKRIFFFRPKTNIRQENAAEYSADNEYSAQGSKHCKKVRFVQETICFLGWQLQVPVDLWATKTRSACMHNTLKKLTFSKKWLGKKSYLKRHFRFRQHLPNIRFGRIFGR
jgi:hypothetical protein